MRVPSTRHIATTYGPPCLGVYILTTRCPNRTRTHTTPSPFFNKLSPKEHLLSNYTKLTPNNSGTLTEANRPGPFTPGESFYCQGPAKTTPNVCVSDIWAGPDDDVEAF